MADEIVRITDGGSLCRIQDPVLGALAAPLAEISSAGALLKGELDFEANAYLDCTIELRGQPPRKFFAHVVGKEPGGLRVRWMHLDPAEGGRLGQLLDAYRAQEAATTESAHVGTRRVLRAKGSAPPATEPAKSADPDASSSTRRVIRPRAPGDAAPAAEPAQPESSRSGTRRVVRARQPSADEPALPPVVIGEERPAAEAKPAPAPAPAEPGKPAAEAPEHAPTASSPDPLHVPAAPAGGSGRMSVIKDGRMDVRASILNRAKTVRASDLAARHDKVRVLNMSTIKQLIQEAVEEAVNHLSRALGEAERKRLMEEAEEGFKERMKAFMAEKQDAEKKAKALTEQLKSAQDLLEQERKRAITADQFTVSQAGLEELDVRMTKAVERAVRGGAIDAGLEGQLRTLIQGVLDSEREKIREKELAAHNEKIALLEKKVSRLANNLEETERQRDEAREIAQHLEKFAGQGLSVDQIRNKYKAGLAADDPDRERKLAMMRELLEENRELRRKLGIAFNEGAADRPAEKAGEAGAGSSGARAAVAVDATPSGGAAVLADDEAGEDAAPDEAAPAEDATEAAGDAVPDGDPDDQPWQAEAEAEAAPAADVNPDDLPWDGGAAPAAATAEAEAAARGVKLLKDYKRFEPPPLAK